ncbi:DHS-like NAD/FAD-binding domain-containing protein [Kalaharituber pfeilii]|nr:DHS-like NAD/FAD-binding domain-containing protein [Kalaharituber pfeilii]
MSISIRIPYTTPFPPPIIHPGRTLLLTGAGVSVDSGLADYRGENGIYRLNKRYRPIFYGEFIAKHEARKSHRYWARSFLGWPTVEKARPNKAHLAIARLSKMRLISGIITQNIDSLHHISHIALNSMHVTPSCRAVFDYLSSPANKMLEPPIVEIHGTLRHVGCLICSSLYPRDEFQQKLASLNLAWSEFLEDAQRKGIFSAESTREGRIRTNPDGDIDLPGMPYTKFRYPPCPKCLDGGGVKVDEDGSHLSQQHSLSKTEHAKGILKPSVVFFGESVQQVQRNEADRLVDDCDRILVIGSSLATYSAWKLVREVAQKGKSVGIINLGGVRGEAEFFEITNGERLRLELPAADVLAGVVEAIKSRSLEWASHQNRLHDSSIFSALGG